MLIVNADDFGLCSGSDRAAYKAMQCGIVTSTSIMVPASHFRQSCEYVKRNKQLDVGVHLTLNSEWSSQKWSPVLSTERVKSLVDVQGYFHPTYAATMASTCSSEVRAELRAQIECALSVGVDVTHLDSHMCVLHGGRADLRSVYLELAREYQLPIRAARGVLMHWHGFSSLPAAAEEFGVVHPDYFGVLSRVRPRRCAAFWRQLLRRLPAGVTEISCHLADAVTELPDNSEEICRRTAEFEFLSSAEARELVKERNIRLIGYRSLREFMRTDTARRDT